jgi:glycerol-3-phosphate acyltransferase PlsY
MHILFLIGAFLLGSFPTGVVVARAKGVDLRKVGSGNIGTTNVGRALGRGWAALVLLVDAGKGALPVVLAAGLFELDLAAGGCGAGRGAGAGLFHFSQRPRRKGVATSLGAGLALAPLPALACVVVWVALFAGFAFRPRLSGGRGQLPHFPLAVHVRAASPT